jgi:hypothetical protein
LDQDSGFISLEHLPLFAGVHVPELYHPFFIAAGDGLAIVEVFDGHQA